MKSLSIIFIFVFSVAAFGQSGMVFADLKNKVYYASDCREIANIKQSDLKSFFSVAVAEKNGFVKADVCSLPAEPAPAKPAKMPAPKRMKNLLEIGSDPYGFARTPLIVSNAKIKLSKVYGGAYNNAENTHLAFTLSDGTDSIQVYLGRNEVGAELMREQLVGAANENTEIFGAFTFIYSESSFNSYSKNIHAKLLDFNPPEREITKARVSRMATGKPVKVANLLTVSSDMENYIDVMVKINGSLQVSNQYGSTYGSSQKTHYAFTLFDEFDESATVYMSRGESAERLRNSLLKAKAQGNDALTGTFTFVIKQERFVKGQTQIFAELVDYAPREK